MDLKTLIVLLVALCPTIVEVFHNLWVMAKQTKMYDNIAQMYDLTSVKNKLNKQLIENAKLQKAIKSLYKVLYKYANGVELSDEDVEKLVEQDNQGSKN